MSSRHVPLPHRKDPVLNHPHLSRALGLATLTAGTLLFAGCPTNPASTSTPIAPPSGFTTYTASADGYKVSYPASWTRAASSPISFTSTTGTDFNVEVASAGATTDPVAALNAAIPQLKTQLSNYSQVSGPASASMGGQSAGQMTYTFTVNGVTVEAWQVVAIHEGNAYVLTLGDQQANYATDLLTLQQIEQTFTFTS